MSRTLISINKFDNRPPKNLDYNQTYRPKSCTFCSNLATEIAIFDVDGIILQERYCNKCVKDIR